ncbi:MAG: hypothetical protein ACXVEF_26420 [Polyangiales bacterium]
MHRWSVLVAIGLAGCNPCRTLDDKLCADLGPADCAVWQAHRRTPKRGPDMSCDLMVSDRGYYENALRDARDQVARWKK